MKKLKFDLEIEFSKDIKLTKEIEKEITQRLLDALVSQVNNEGIVPDDAEYYTTSIDVKRFGFSCKHRF